MKKNIAQQRIKDNLQEIETLIKSMEEAHNLVKNDFKIRMARVYMYETVKILEENDFPEAITEKIIAKITKFTQELNFFQTLKVKKSFALLNRRI